MELLLLVAAAAVYYLAVVQPKVVEAAAPVAESAPETEGRSISLSTDMSAEEVGAEVLGIALGEISEHFAEDPDPGAVLGAAASGAAVGALIGLGPAGILAAGVLAAVDVHGAMMEEIAAWREIKFMCTPGEYAEWEHRRRKAKDSLDVTVHNRLHDYEVKKTDKYTSEAGRLDFIQRVDLWSKGDPNALCAQGVGWAVAEGIEITPEGLARIALAEGDVVTAAGFVPVSPADLPSAQTGVLGGG